MRTPVAAARNRISLKASHRRMSLRISHRSESGTVERTQERERYIAPPRKRR